MDNCYFLNMLKKAKEAITKGEFNFWKFIIITLVSAAFSAGVAYQAVGSGIDANAKGIKEQKESMEALVTREQTNKGQFYDLVETVNKIQLDLTEVKTDVKWLVKNSN